MGVGDQRRPQAALPPEKGLDAYWTGGWLSPWAGLDGGRKISPPTWFDSRTAALVVDT